MLRPKHVHLSDEALVSFLDGEMPPRMASRTEVELQRCAQCRGRRALFETLLRTTEILEKEESRRFETELPDSSSAVLRLKSRITARPGGSKAEEKTPVLSDRAIRQLLCATAALLLVALDRWSWDRLATPELFGARVEAAALPQRALTPGAVRKVAVEELCGGKEPVSNDPPVDASLQAAVFHEYGVRASTSARYSLDYLITPALGGTGNIHNLWPQPSSTRWNAGAKDRLEDHLHTLVCERQLPLEEAQQEIATDWIAAYRKYFPAAEGSAGPGPVLAIKQAGPGFPHSLLPGEGAEAGRLL